MNDMTVKDFIKYLQKEALIAKEVREDKEMPTLTSELEKRIKDIPPMDGKLEEYNRYFEKIKLLIYQVN